jgi:hypothetical protein
MVHLRNIPILDTDSLTPSEAREALFRDWHGFVLYLSNYGQSASNEERIIRLGAREALIWLNESELDRGSFCGYSWCSHAECALHLGGYRPNRFFWSASA